jgi:hypothetical protein
VPCVRASHPPPLVSTSATERTFRRAIDAGKI